MATDAAAKDFDYSDVMLSRELVHDLQEDGDADVTVDMGGTVIDVFRVSYDPRRERFILYCHPDDIAEVLRKPRCLFDHA